MEHSFEPIIDRRSKLLILGSLPGAVSLKKNEYYANRLNRFWEILFSVMGRPFSTDYLSKVMFLRDNHIALWDVIKSAERTGSSDSNIKTAVANDIPKLLQDNPGISFLIFNGRFSFNSYKKFFGKPQMPFEVLLSTSPACAGRDKEKHDMWERALKGALGDYEKA
jgi:hypoxanthine-DNA glycosylase